LQTAARVKNVPADVKLALPENAGFAPSVPVPAKAPKCLSEPALQAFHPQAAGRPVGRTGNPVGSRLEAAPKLSSGSSVHPLRIKISRASSVSTANSEWPTLKMKVGKVRVTSSSLPGSTPMLISFCIFFSSSVER